MKDAKGHGSDAHSSGVQQVGKPSAAYHWEKKADGFHELVGDEPHSRIARVSPAENGYIRGEYDFPFSTETKQSDGAYHGNVTGAKNWVEGKLSGFWEPPTIRK